MGSITGYEGADLGQATIAVTIFQFVYLILIQFTILNLPGKLYWIINFFLSISFVYIIWFCHRFMQNETEYLRNLLPIVITIGTIVSFTSFLEALFVSLDTLFETSPFGKVICIFIGFGLSVVYFVLSNDAR